VTPEGDVTPCPYLPLVAGSLRAQSFAEIWNGAEAFRQLRQPTLTGRCGACEFASVCGGCRARAYASHRDPSTGSELALNAVKVQALLGEDPWCNYQPGSGPALPAPSAGDERVEWTEAAWMRLERVPPFVRPMVKRGVEAYALSRGLTTITPVLMLEVRDKAMPVRHGDRPPG
jgi:radical SAM protein with 4Fe4S-binding SPASM domain